ncbi:hypothetical protein CFD26_105610 [Aspergillus turcosus]|uniref:Uncharacterized protein n=1 Tax=Aspergillus turcosus TaxID=1245748 RepID=A0A3R7IDM1_9EURO|nr:hypothetical protein CFD26_105610 [Aspergillus turcosus]
MFRQLSLLYRTRGNDHDEHMEDEEGPLPPSVQRPLEQENVQMLLEESEFKERRNKLIHHLDSIYRKAYNLGKPFFDPTICDKLKIRCETLDLKSDGEYANGAPAPNFFDPFPLETLKKHPIITPDDRARRDYQSYEDIFDRTEEGFASQALSYRLMCHFDGFRRNGITSRRGRLMDVTLWREAYVSHFVSITRNVLLIYLISRSEFPEFIQEYFMPGVCLQRGHSPSPGACWTAQSTPLPHIMCIVEFMFGGTEELLRGEILTILATTITRLELEGYQGEVVIPVLLFSIMSDFKARIIQAYFDGDQLVIRKSKLYDFSTRETLSSSTTLFMQWMASQPVGDTSGFPLKDFVPFEEEDNTKSSVKEEAESKGTADAP